MTTARQSASVALLVCALVLGVAPSALADSSGGIGNQSGGSSGGSTAGSTGGSTGTGAAGELTGLNWLTQRATWYGPGFFGNTTACGQTLTRSTVGVAHRTLPCGSRVAIRYDGRTLRTRVIDRGPYANGAKWDLTQAAAQRVGFEYTDEIQVAKLAARR